MEPSDREIKAVEESAQFRGEMIQRLRDGDDQFREIKDELRVIKKKQTEQGDELTKINVKVAFYGALGGGVGTVVVGLVVAFGTKAIG